jgi:DNA-binding NarL/FixJ family response regulator
MPAQDDMTIQVGGLTVRLAPEHLAVMRLVALGMTYREIGRELGLSRNTVCNRVCDVKNRLGTQSRTVAVLALRDAGSLE